MKAYKVALYKELVVEAENRRDALVKAAEHFQAANMVDVSDLEVLVDVVDFDGNKIGETYADCGEPGCCGSDTSSESEKGERTT